MGPADGLEVDVHAFCGPGLEVDASANGYYDPASDGVAALAIGGVEVDSAPIGGDGRTLSGRLGRASAPCATVRLYDADGGLSSESAPRCVEGFECPLPDHVGLIVTADRGCDDEQTDAVVLVQFPADPDGAGGTLTLALTTERETVFTSPLRWVSGDQVPVELSARGSRDACVVATYTDVFGVEAWSTEGTCLEPGPVCAWDDDLEGAEEAAGCGCASGTTPGAGWLAAAVALVRRRGRSGYSISQSGSGS